MRTLVTIILIAFYSISFSQSLSENDIKEMAKYINAELKGTDLGNGITMRACLALKRTLIYQYDVNEYWYPTENMKEDLISNFKEMGTADNFFKNKINVDLHYYLGNKLLKKVSIKSSEFSNLNFDLGDYISIEGHPKAKGVNLKIKPPVNWKIEEGNRPNIIKKFGYNGNSYMIMVKDNITFFSRNEMRELLEDDVYINEFITEFTSSSQQSELLNYKIVTIDKYPSLEFKMRDERERLGIKISLISKSWVIFYEDKLVLLQCMGLHDAEFYSLEVLFDLITNSVIFPEQYN